MSIQQPASAPKRLHRNRDDAVVAGVCAGIADYTGLDVRLVRVLTVIGVLLGLGSLAVAYIAAWVLVPKG